MKSNKKKSLLPLAPKNDLDKSHFQFSVYTDHLDDVFANKCIRNIALAGNLGSGKTSIIKSYDRLRNGGKEKFLYVSLIDFTSAGGKSTGKQRDLEYSLFCQVLSRCKQSDIAESSISAIPSKSRFLRPMSFFLALVCLMTFVLVFHEQFGELAKLIGIPGKLSWAIHVVLYGCMAGSLGVLGYTQIKKLLPLSRFHKLTLKSTLADAEIVLGKERTCLDAFKLELIYALSQIRKRIDYTVVLEDMDRVEEATAVEIMEKLRELNILTNSYIETNVSSYRKNGNTEHIRFVYTIGEDIFDYEQRTKFYDCIIPVIPSLNYCNASQTISKVLSQCGIDVYRDQISFVIKQIAPIVTNYRTLITIRNEYLVFSDLYKANHKKQIHHLTYQEQATLLSIIVYKTLFPGKYAAAFSEFGQAKLERIRDTDLIAFGDHPVHNSLIFEVFEKLFDAKILTATSLRLVGLTDALITERWLRILTGGTDTEKIRLLSTLIISDYANSADNPKEAKRFFKNIIKKNLLGLTSNTVLSNHIALFLASSSWNDYKWIFNGFSWGNSTSPTSVQKRHFTNCFHYIVTENRAALETLCKKHGKKYIQKWCIWNLRGFGNHELVDYGWTLQMANTLVGYLKYEPRTVPVSVCAKYITNDYTIGQLLQAEYSPSH